MRLANMIFIKLADLRPSFRIMLVLLKRFTRNSIVTICFKYDAFLEERPRFRGRLFMFYHSTLSEL